MGNRDCSSKSFLFRYAELYFALLTSHPTSAIVAADVLIFETGTSFLDRLQGNKDRQFVTALARGLEILRAFRRGDRFLGNQELSARTGLPKPTISRLTHTLTSLGYLVYSAEAGKYGLGAPVLSLGYAALANYDIRQIARPAMAELASHANASVALGALDRDDMVYVQCCKGGAALTLNLDVGSRVPLATSAMGRAYLAALPETDFRAKLNQLEQAQPDKWADLLNGIEQARRDYQTLGFCLSLCEWQPDVNAVAVPLVGYGDHGIMAFNCGGSAFALPKKRLIEDLGPRLVALANGLKSAKSAA
jgi:DNA-binding IclR family transcriptional regulator